MNTVGLKGQWYSATISGYLPAIRDVSAMTVATLSGGRP